MTQYVCDITHITLQVVGLPCLDAVILVRVARPLTQVVAILDIADQVLTVLRCYKRHHVRRDVNSGLCLVVVRFVQPVVLDLASVLVPHQFWIIPHTGNPNVVTSLFDVLSFVFKLIEEGERCIKSTLITYSFSNL